MSCLNASESLVDFSHCDRFPKSGTKDIIDWPQDSRDGYVMTDVTTVINAFSVGSLRKLAELARANGAIANAQQLDAEAATIAGGMSKHLFDSEAGVFVDSVGTTHTVSE